MVIQSGEINFNLGLNARSAEQEADRKDLSILLRRVSSYVYTGW